MENQVPPVIVKQEQADEDKKEVAETSETPLEDQSANATEPCNLKLQKVAKKAHPPEKLFDNKRIKKESQPFPEKEAKAKKTTADDIEACAEPPRSGVFPYRTKSDFCCTICNAHMNSIQMWESHIRGKRHSKNCKKGSVSAAAPVPMEKEKVEDVEGLYYIDTQGAQSPQHSNVTYERRPESPGDSKPKEYHSASPVATATSSLETINISELNMTMTEKIDYMLKLSSGVFPQSESDCAEIKSIMAALTQSILQYEIRQLPLATQQKVAKELFRGN